ncbi:hypothetical protein KIH87_07295 [Paraneptunicella aestuarii]|uniref:hypothetical protein n=1 Tax=Paraneptunicella aestuarii TaxID=2831148 RepID=UPI001E5D63C2|nr:hypothetical protein [Paraneptunicella aestuarii]UAA40143.1 hypothetical protein KIH87_07295 [Paraneptunicella aestuarii]
MGLDELSLLFGDYLPFLYTVVFFIGLKAFRQNTSLTMLALVLALAEFSMYVIRDPLWAWANKNPAVPYDIRLLGWYGCWVVCYAAMIILLLKVHEWTNITKSNPVTYVQQALWGQGTLQLIMLANALTFNLKPISLFYQFAIPITNVFIALYVMYAILRNTIHVDIKVTANRNSGL